jgi:hypothetical protein
MSTIAAVMCLSSLAGHFYGDPIPISVGFISGANHSIATVGHTTLFDMKSGKGLSRLPLKIWGNLRLVRLNFNVGWNNYAFARNLWSTC